MARKVSTVYKVVRADRAKLVSAMSSLPQSWIVTYVPGRWVAPRHTESLLFAFRTEEWARRFMGFKPFELWRADAEVATKRSGFWQVTNGLAWITSCYSPALTMLGFWTRKTPTRTASAPTDSLGCRRIRLIERVK